MLAGDSWVIVISASRVKESEGAYYDGILPPLSRSPGDFSFPGRRIPAHVRNGEDVYDVIANDKKDTIRVVLHLSSACILVYSWETKRRFFDGGEYFVKCQYKTPTQAGPLQFIPLSRSK